jgi:hypothetical protein
MSDKKQKFHTISRNMAFRNSLFDEDYPLPDPCSQAITEFLKSLGVSDEDPNIKILVDESH